MHADLSHLASDELGGRYTLADDIDRAAAYLVDEYKKIGVGGVNGGDLIVRYPLATGAQATAPATLSLHRGSRETKVTPGDFSPLAEGKSGEVRGPAVFVGYGVQVPATKAEPADDGGEGKPARPGYDDLAGVDLKDKVAVLLLDTPGQPNMMAMFERMQATAESFDEQSKPLQKAKDEAGMKALHIQARKDLGALLERFMGGEKLPKSFFEAPEDPMSGLDLGRMLGPVMAQTERSKGPQFGFRAGRLRTKLENVAEAGAVGAVVVRGPASFLSDADKKEDAFPDLADAGIGSVGAVGIPVVQMHWKRADKLLRPGGKTLSKVQAKIDSTLTPRSGPIAGVEIALGTQVQAVTRDVPNVVATIPGTDLASEVVLIGAHFDHIGTSEEGRGRCTKVTNEAGVDGICNGADDNASGTAMVLELARAIKASGTPPRRTLVFAHFSGEELGLHGSRALAQAPNSAPPAGGKTIVAMINLDMVGRLGPRGLAIGGISSSSAWMPLLDEVGAKGLKITYERSITSRSDHANFYKKDIPVLFFFTQTHADYHRATDHVDKINREGMAVIGEMVTEVVVELAGGLSIPFTPPKSEFDGLVGGLPGSNPASVEKKVDKAPRGN